MYADSLDTVTTLTAPCGHTLAPGQGERVEQFEGLPCIPCLLLTLAAADAHTQRTEYGTSLITVNEVNGDGKYAIGLRGDHVRHLVADTAIRGQLDGRSVVHSACGHLGFGPLESGPTHWPLCAECVSATAAAP